MDKYLGRRLDGRYELREIIGVGGMAYVYRAYDTIDDRIVAVKILKDEYLHNEEFSRRFKNESKAIAILSHRNIVRVNDVSFSDSLQYIVMEYIDGITLKEYIEQQKVLQWKEVVHFIVQILQALQHAHDKGIVHQDVKPQNIMLLSDGTIKVTDFGIARFSRVAGQQSEQGDKAIGSVHYISPEQARAEITDEKSDIYSVGVMMYEMLTGKLPFESDNAVRVAIMQMQSVAERPTSINPDIPEGLEEITLKAMQKDPAKRYQSAAEMLYDIDEFKNNPSIRFEYKYFSGADDAAHYEEAFNKIRKTDKPSANPERDKKGKKGKSKSKAKDLPIIPLLAGIAGAAILVMMVILGIYLITTIFNVSSQPVTQNVSVPPLVGKNYEKDVANNTQYARDFTIVINEAYDKSEPGTIFKQRPLDGKEVKLKSELVLYVSLGQEKIEVPQIEVGTDKEEVIDILTKAGFLYRVINENSDTIPEGGLISMEPKGGEEAQKNSEITLYVSIGEEPIDDVVVPNVATMSQEDAITALTDKGLIVNEESIKQENHPTYSEGKVIEQTPAAGEEVPPGSEVWLTVSSGYKDLELEVKLPSITDMVDMDVYVEDSLFYSEDGVLPMIASPMVFDLSEQKAEYTVTVELSAADEDDFKTYAVFTINGKEGTVTSRDYRAFSVTPTTTTAEPTTTSTAYSTVFTQTTTTVSDSQTEPTSSSEEEDNGESDLQESDEESEE